MSDTKRLSGLAIDGVARRGIGAFLPLLLDVELPDITRVILYGSRARGDHHDESDVDLAVVLAGHRPDSEGDIALRLSRRLTEAILECRLCTQIDVSLMLVWEGELVDPEATSNPGFYRDVLAHGVKIYRAEWIGEAES